MHSDHHNMSQHDGINKRQLKHDTKKRNKTFAPWNTKETHYIQHQQSIPTIQGNWATISIMTPIYKQDVKTSQHKQWQKIQIKVSFFFYFNLCNYSILPLMLTSSNFLTLQIYHCGLSILIHKGKSTKARRVASLKATATQAFCRVQPLTPPKPTSY